MNFLAHLYLAGPHEHLRLGAVMGDFIKGPLPGGLSSALAAGVALHRRIDAYAETHPAFCRSRQRVSPLRRRYAGILVDLFYDHFLARYWSEFHPDLLMDFTDEAYQMLACKAPCLPDELNRITPYMASQDWLGSYARPEAVGQALDRMGQRRLRQPNPLAGSLAELEADYAGFEADFRHFMADAGPFAQGFWPVAQGAPIHP